MNPPLAENIDERLIRVHLPNEQHTTLKFERNSSLKDALEKALENRFRLKIDDLEAFRITKEKELVPFDWDAAIGFLQADDEVELKFKENLPNTHTELSHNIVDFKLQGTKCNICKEKCEKGFKCEHCGIHFHKKVCGNKIPALCKPEGNDNRGRENGYHSESDSCDESDTWIIDASKIEKGEWVGHGSFATVYKGIYFGPVALKELNVNQPTKKQLKNFKKEIKLLKNIRHANVLLFRGYVQKPRPTIVTQWCEGRSLYKYLHIDERRDMTDSEILSVSISVAHGMQYLHSREIFHRDLKSNNIFIHDEEDFSVKIGDFGLSTFKKSYEGDQETYHPTGSILWMAPEVIRAKSGVDPFTNKSDVYSYGLVLYELLTRKLPYFDYPHKEALFFLIGCGDELDDCNGSLDEELGNPVLPKLNLDAIKPKRPKIFTKLMLKCQSRNPDARPSFDIIVENLKKITLPRITRTASLPNRLEDLYEELPNHLSKLFANNNEFDRP